MKKIILLPILLTSFLSGCGSTEQGEKMINDFETIQELSLMKFPSKSHADRAKIELTNEHVTHGDKSMKITNFYGSSYEMHHFFTNTSSGKLDGADIKSIELDIYNDSDFDTTAKLIIYNNEDLDILLEKEFDVFKGMNNHLSFQLSKIALENNSNTLISSSLCIYTAETDYASKVGYTFYIDNWHAVMGNVMTDEDKIYKSMVDSVKNEIDALPKENEITLLDYDALNQAALHLSAIPSLYRRIVPNVNEFNKKIDAFYRLKKLEYIPNGKLDTYVPCTEFYGVSAVSPYLNTKASIYFSDVWKEEISDAGSTLIEFSGSLHNYFQFDSIVSLKNYDYLEITFHNETGHFTRIWFSYFNNVFADIYDGETVSVQLKINQIIGQNYWVIDQCRAPKDGTIVPATGSIFIGAANLIGVPIEEKIADMKYAFDHLPAVESVVGNENQFINNISYVSTARELYNTYKDDYGQSISQEKINLLESLESLYAANGYVSQMSGYNALFSKYFYGGEVFSTRGIKDQTYGFVSKVSIPKDYLSEDGSNVEQAISYTNDMLLRPNSNGYVINVYNPTDNPVNLVVKNTGWQWEIYGAYYTYTTVPAKSWKKVEIKSILFSDDASPDHKIAIFLSATKNGKNTLVGDWLFSSLVGIPREI